AGEPQCLSRGIHTAELVGQCRDALALTIWTPRTPSEQKQLCETHIWLMSVRQKIWILKSVIPPCKIEKVFISDGLVIVSHVRRIDQWVLIYNNREGTRRDFEVWLKGNYAVRDLADGPKNIDERVGWINSAVVKTDKKVLTVWHNGESGLPLI